MLRIAKRFARQLELRLMLADVVGRFVGFGINQSKHDASTGKFFVEPAIFRNIAIRDRAIQRVKMKTMAAASVRHRINGVAVEVLH